MPNDRLPGYLSREPLRGRAPRSFDDELSAGGADIPSPALPHRHREMVIGESLRELVDRLVGWPFEWNPRRGVQRDQIHLRFHARQQSGTPVPVCRRIVAACQQDVLERDASPALQRKALAGLDDVGDTVLLVNGDELAAN